MILIEKKNRNKLEDEWRNKIEKKKVVGLVYILLEEKTKSKTGNQSDRSVSHQYEPVGITPVILLA
ncbi:predicted protein [Sclerotinia sclerotiorum 1980 UF-70]|uniref:Uncharacterized protein n=1 Tax=Sclerotinia sclerotiorum (strain ATCC 18683 / 1980 / Ss-1) TaxID=665079 RepID=A7ERH5_SCLS1|nr:predicted protein [Sclerotinia sclerotiorum 1980 UF-70]EDN92067.1 predicted protein [Sclerotinia sclerotiorum 1980 UF-70]